MRVKILSKMTVALDDLGYRLADCVNGDVVDLSTDHGNALIAAKLASKVSSDTPVTAGVERKPRTAGRREPKKADPKPADTKPGESAGGEPKPSGDAK